MKSRMLREYSRSHVLGVVAIFIALTGTSYAVATGSIGSREIKNNIIRSKDIRNDQVRSADVRDGSLLARDFKAGELGATGAQGPKGDTGLPGEPGMSGYVQVNAFSAGDSSQEQSATATCPQGTKVVGGGAVINTGGSRVDLALASSLPISDGSGWAASGVETTAHAGTWTVNARAICANVAP
jgi:hypothetical protein